MRVAFVHGVPETAAIWEPLTDAVVARGVDEVVTLAPPGFGVPTPSGWQATAPEYADWLVAAVAELAADGPVHLLGHDWGAGHVFGLLAQRPDLVASWATDCVGLVHPEYVWHDTAQVWQTPDAGEEWIDGVVGLDDAQRAELFTALGLPADTATAVSAGVDAEMGRCILALYRSAVQPFLADLGARATQQLAAPEAPRGAAIIATADEYVSAEQGVAMAATLGADVITLDGAGHWWMFGDSLGTVADALVAHWSTAGS